MHTSSSSTTTSSSSQRCSRPALVNRTNSDDLNDLALAAAAAAAATNAGKSNKKTYSLGRSLKGSKKQTSNATTRQQSHHQEVAASQDDTLVDGAKRRVADIHNSDDIVGSSNSENMQQLLVTKKNQHRASTSSTLPTVSSYDASSDDSDDDDDGSDTFKNVNNTSNNINSYNNNNNNNNNSNNNNKIITWEHGWLHDDGLTKTTVYYRNLHRPISLLQAAFRSKLTRRHLRQARIQQLQAEIWQLQDVAALRIQTQLFRRMQERQSRHRQVAVRFIQARVRLIQAKQARAITLLQAIARGWMARLQYKTRLLEQQLAHIHARRERELRCLRHYQTLEMHRVDAEYQVIAGKACHRQGEILKAASQEIYDLRGQNRDLRHENEALQNASFILLKKNEQTLEVTSIHKQNLQQLQDHVVPQFERDQAQIAKVHDDYVHRVQRYEQALELRHEHLLFERNVTKCLQQTIHVLLQNIDERLCINDDDVSLKRAILYQAREVLHSVTTTTTPNMTTTKKENDSNTSNSD